MNCQDIAQILDERAVASLLADENAAVQAHLVGCPDCARDWQIHARLSGIAIPAVPDETRALYPVNAGAVSAGARRNNRFILIGTLVALAAAASMLVMQMNRTVAPVATPVATIMESNQVVSAGLSAPGQALASVEPEVRREGLVQSATGTAQAPAVAATGLRILLMPTLHNAEDKAARPAIDAFFSALLQALRNTPDVVVEAGPGSAKDQSVNRVTVVSPLVTTPVSGRPIYHSGDGQSTWQEFGGPTYRYSGPPRWPVELLLEDARNRGSYSTVNQFVDGSGIPTGAGCNANVQFREGERTSAPGNSAPTRLNGVPAWCSSAEGLAAWIIDVLRPRSPSPVVTSAQLLSRLSDPSTYDRPGIFLELLSRARKGDIVLDTATLEAITAYVSSLPPAQRITSMISLRGVRRPELVVPLLAFLQKDGDEKVRLEALTTLTADYPNDARIHAASERVARQDASPLVRMAAQRTVSGDAQWQSYVVATLADRSLSSSERLAPALQALRSITHMEGLGSIQAYLGSELVTRQLLDIFEGLRTQMSQLGAEVPADLPPGLAARLAELGAPPSTARPVQGTGAAGPGGFVVSSPGQGQQDEAVQGVLSLLNITNPAAAIDLRIRILTESPRPPSWLAMNALNGLLERRDDPRVGKVLDDIAAGKSGTELRDALQRQQNMRQLVSPPRAPETIPAVSPTQR